MTIELSKMMQFGIQYVLKSNKACKQIKLIDVIKVSDEKLRAVREIRKYNSENMEEMVAEERVKLKAKDKGKLFSQLMKDRC